MGGSFGRVTPRGVEAGDPFTLGMDHIMGDHPHTKA